MRQDFLKEAFSVEGNNGVFLKKAEHRAACLKEVIMRDVREIQDSPDRYRGKREFPIKILSFDYVGIDQNHYVHRLERKQIAFSVERNEARFAPFHHLVLRFTPDELVDILDAYPRCSGVSNEILAAMHQLGHISRETEMFTLETMSEYAFDHAQRKMAQWRDSRRPGEGPIPA